MIQNIAIFVLSSALTICLFTIAAMRRQIESLWWAINLPHPQPSPTIPRPENPEHVLKRAPDPAKVAHHLAIAEDARDTAFTNTDRYRKD